MFANLVNTILVLFLTYSVYRTIKFGRRMRFGDFSMESRTMDSHRRWANTTILILLALILVIEFDLFSDGRSERGTLFYSHLTASVVAFVLLLFSRFIITGKVYKVIHRRAGWAMVLAFAVSIPTGLVLTWR